MATVAAYIDGFNLYYGMKNKYRRRYLWLDVVKLIQEVRPDDEVKVVRYFTAIVKNEPAAAQNQDDYLAALRAHNGPLVDVRLGRFNERKVKPCRRCGRPYECGCPREVRSWEEKETDVALGAMMVADAALNLADITLLISADTDLAPALAAVLTVKPGREIVLVMPPGNTGASRHLLRAANVNLPFFLNDTVLRAAQLPANVIDQTTNRTYTRPTKWQ